MSCNHKIKGFCKIKNCNKSRRSRGRCKICGTQRFMTTCNSHFSNGEKRTRVRGKKTTKSTRKRRRAEATTKVTKN